MRGRPGEKKLLDFADLDKKAVKKAKDAARYQANKEAIRIKNQAKKEEIAVKNKIYAETHKEERKDYLETNKTKIQAQGKEYYENNKDEIKLKAEVYRAGNKEKVKITWQAYDKKNQEKIKNRRNDYRETNKTKIQTQDKDRYEKNKEKIKDQRRARYQQQQAKKRKAAEEETISRGTSSEGQTNKRPRIMEAEPKSPQTIDLSLAPVVQRIQFIPQMPDPQSVLSTQHISQILQVQPVFLQMPVYQQRPVFPQMPAYQLLQYIPATQVPFHQQSHIQQPVQPSESNFYLNPIASQNFMFGNKIISPKTTESSHELLPLAENKTTEDKGISNIENNPLLDFDFFENDEFSDIHDPSESSSVSIWKI